MAPGRAPVRKVKASGVGGAVATVAAWALDSLPGFSVPALVAAALSTLVMAGVAYQVAPAPGDQSSSEESSDA